MSYQRWKFVELASELVRSQPGLTEAECADKLHIHRHTLQRALKAGGCSFALIKRAFVLERLKDNFASARAISLKQVWTELGFASGSAFARYIRHATGKSPSELRADCSSGHSVSKRARMNLDLGKPKW